MVHAFIMVKTGAGESEQLLGPIRDFETVTEAHIVAGAYDIIAKVEVDSPADVKDIAVASSRWRASKTPRRTSRWTESARATRRSPRPDRLSPTWCPAARPLAPAGTRR